MDFSNLDKDDIQVAKQVSGVIVICIVVLVMILIGIMFGWSAFFISLILFFLFIFWLLRTIINSSEAKLKKEDSGDSTGK